MAKLYFRYWAMWAGKSMDILKVHYNYKERWMNTLLFNSKIDTRFGQWVIASRAWLKQDSIEFDTNTKFKEIIENELKKFQKIDCILVDESQFLTPEQVDEFRDLSIFSDIPVICYWLRTDFRTQLFPGSKRLFELSDEIEELKTVCWCGKKASVNTRLIDWKITTDWDQVCVWWNESYISLCMKHYLERKLSE